MLNKPQTIIAMIRMPGFVVAWIVAGKVSVMRPCQYGGFYQSDSYSVIATGAMAYHPHRHIGMVGGRAFLEGQRKFALRNCPQLKLFLDTKESKISDPVPGISCNLCGTGMFYHRSPLPGVTFDFLTHNPRFQME